MFEERAKLFRYVEKEWRERGTGILKLLHNPVQGSVRVLMRRDQVSPATGISSLCQQLFTLDPTNLTFHQFSCILMTVFVSEACLYECK